MNAELWLPEAASLLASLLLVLLYVTVQERTRRSHPLLTTRGTMQLVHSSWVQSHLRGGQLPVITLREFSSASHFYAHASLAICLGLAGYLFTMNETHLGGGLAELPSPQQLLFLKLLSVLVLHAFTFYAFTQATRNITYTSFLINTDCIRTAEGSCYAVTAPVVERFLRHASQAWTAGTLGQVATFPLILWVYGPLAMVLGTAALLLGFRLLPWGEYEDKLSTGVCLETLIEASQRDDTAPASEAPPSKGPPSQYRQLLDTDADQG